MTGVPIEYSSSRLDHDGSESAHESGDNEVIDDDDDDALATAISIWGFGGFVLHRLKQSAQSNPAYRTEEAIAKIVPITDVPDGEYDSSTDHEDRLEDAVDPLPLLPNEKVTVKTQVGEDLDIDVPDSHMRAEYFRLLLALYREREGRDNGIDGVDHDSS